MVRHKRRGGWEMPGGRLEPGETPEQAVRREFLEETGHILLDIKECMTEPRGGKVFGGIVGKKVSEPRPDEIAEVGMFNSLPSPLSFPKVEYEKMLASIRPLFLDKRY
jgi:8-oxo-dGTP diphosphatase